MQTARTKLNNIRWLNSEISTLYKKISAQLKDVKTQTSNYNVFMSDFFSIVSASWLSSSLFNSNILLAGTRKLCVVISCESGLCGSLNKSLFKNVIKSIDSNTDVFCIWKRAFNFFVDAWFNVVWYIDNVSKSIDLQILDKYLLNSIDKNLYADVSVFFRSHNKNNKFNLYSLTQSDLKLLDVALPADDMYSGLWVQVEEFVLRNMIIQLSQYMVYGAVLQSQINELSYCKNILILRWDNHNLKKFVLSFNEKRQALLTQKVLELMSREYSMS